MKKTLLFIGSVLFLVFSAQTQTINLAPRTNYLAGTAPHSVVIGDMNSDGKPDLVSANENSNDISILFNDGTGNFLPAQNTGVGQAPRTIAIGDVNSDGKLDVVTSNINSNNISLLFGNGMGGFSSQLSYSAGTEPFWVVLGDVNGDNKLDAVTVNRVDNNISVLLNDGTGNFQSQQTYPTGMNPHSLTLGDVNGDGKLDVVTNNFDDLGISILLNNGAGGFQAPENYILGQSPVHAAISDINSDGKPDIMVAVPFPQYVSILLNDGTGHFLFSQNLNSGDLVCFVAIDDLNADGKPDMVAANRFGDNISVFEGDGSGGFPIKTDYRTGDGLVDPFSLAIGDLNADGKPDIAVANWNGTGSIAVFLQKKDQTLTFNNLLVKTYGDADFDPGASASSGLTPTYSSSNPAVATIVAGKVHIAGAGTCTITASQPGNDNYLPAIAIQRALTVDPKAISVIIDAQNKTYGDIDPALTYTFTPALVSGDAFTGTPSRMAGEDVGTYAIVQNTLTLGTNYTMTYTGNNLTISKKTVTIVADAQNKIYGDTDPALTYTYSPALIGGDAFSGSLDRVTGEDAGMYAIRQNTLSLSSNYILTYTGAYFTIDKKDIIVSADAKSKTYGDADPALTYTFSPALISGDAFTGELGRTAGENVGVYPITQSTLSLSSNYTLIYNNADLSIDKKAITVAANAAGKVYGSADPVLTYTVSPALVNGDIFTGSLERDPGENAGTYTITQGNLLNGNYTISFVNGVFTIAKADQQITWIQTLVAGCDGNMSTVLTATASSGLPVSYVSANTGVATVNNNQLIIAGPGTAVVTASQTGNANYNAAPEVQNTLISKLPAYLLVKHWNDVLFFDNSSRQYKAWQWYKNGVLVAGATGQYYTENSSLNGTYHAVVETTAGISLQTCPVTVTVSNAPMMLRAFPNPATPGQSVTIQTDYNSVALLGATLLITDVQGVVLQNLATVAPQTSITAPVIPGIYIVRLRLSNGASHSLNLLVKP